MSSRLNLHKELVDILGSSNVYFQPPESIKLVYPCIIYERNGGETIFSGDMPYLYKKRYSVTIITKDPDSDLVDKMYMAFPECTFDRHFTLDNLNHDVFQLFY